MSLISKKGRDYLSWPNSGYVIATVVLIVALIVSNIAFPATTGWERLIWNILGYLGLYFIFRRSGLTFADIGLAPKYIKRGFLYGLGAIAIISVLFVGGYLVDDQLFQDERYRQSIATALFAVMVLLPLKTVLFEEVAFRGMLPALLMKFKSRRFSIVVSSLAFGLWHVSSSLNVGDYNIAGIAIPGFAFILASVLATSVAGFLFLELRLRSRSLLAPIMVHWFINGAAIMLAAISWS